MRIDIISALPQLLESFFSTSILHRAIEKKIVNIKIHDLRDYSNDKHKKIDDYCYGGEAGMVLKIEPIAKCIKELKNKRKYDTIIYMSPDGNTLNQKKCNELSQKKNIIILCGRYKGVDQRVRDLFIDQEISIGNYVLSGGEIPAAALCDSIIRLIPGVMNNECSALFDSFQDDLIAPPIYTRPENWNGNVVPPILLSGDLKKIKKWNEEQSLRLTEKNKNNIIKL
ncbi:MAG: tRNA (guanosine(37)-N1)-methyltransferase TrmD [Flavobacteriales bacterium TMED113]|nr:MAG: tRNA (guanosine(37)-N1)-methyltransferase TrmD [Flavobacteriales bacterium TMED113]